MPTDISKDTGNGVSNGASNTYDWATTVVDTTEAVARWVLGFKPGEQFTTGEFKHTFESNPHFTLSAVSQILLGWTSHQFLTRPKGVSRGAYIVTRKGIEHSRNVLGLQAAPQGMSGAELFEAAEELEPPETTRKLATGLSDDLTRREPYRELLDSAPVSAVPAYSSGPVVLQHGGVTMTLMADWGPPPPPQSGPEAFPEGMRFHLGTVIAVLKENPGQWMCILVFDGEQGTTPIDQAAAQVAHFEADQTYPQLDFLVREILGSRSAGVWARWVDKPATSKAGKVAATTA